MAKRNAAELLFDMPAGSYPIVAKGPEGVAYRILKKPQYLVIRKVAEQLEASEKDIEKGVRTVATNEFWTHSMTMVLHLVRPVGSKWSKYVDGCRCKRCAKKATDAKSRKKTRQ